MRNLLRQLMSSSSPSALILPHHAFFFLILHPVHHRCGAAGQAEILSAAERAEMADVEPMKKIVPFVNLPLVNMSAS